MRHQRTQPRCLGLRGKCWMLGHPGSAAHTAVRVSVSQFSSGKTQPRPPPVPHQQDSAMSTKSWSLLPFVNACLGSRALEEGLAPLLE